MSWLDEFKEGFGDDALRGPDDQAKQFYRAQEILGKDDDALRLEKYFAEHPLVYRLQEILGDPKRIKDSDKRQVREAQILARQELGMGLKPTVPGKIGQVMGAAVNDVLNDKTRNLYWLLNAAQAAGNVANEFAMNAVNPDLYGARVIEDDAGYPVKYDNKLALQKVDNPLDGRKAARPVGPKGQIAVSPDIKKDRQGNARLRNYRSGAVAALGVPAGFAINQGLGLMTPFGGYEGYEAALPSKEDPTKTSNVLGEIATKYFMGRTGNLLPYDEFKKVRPDVSKDEYMRYKAFKFDKEGDLNPFDDGQMTVPTGIIKTTTEGIHGPEVQFLGRSLPVTTALIPFAGAVAGGMMGVKKRVPDEIKSQGKRAIEDYVDRRAVKRGIMGGALGTAAGMTVGNLLEAERRRRNQAENESQLQL